MEDLIKFGMRNPIRINVSPDGAVNTEENIFKNPTQNAKEDKEELVTPKELQNFYVVLLIPSLDFFVWNSISVQCVPAEVKFLAMVKFLKSQKESKVLIFVSNASQAEYFSLILPPFLDDPKRLVFSLHRKMDQKRQKIVSKFQNEYLI